MRKFRFLFSIALMTIISTICLAADPGQQTQTTDPTTTAQPGSGTPATVYVIAGQPQPTPAPRAVVRRAPAPAATPPAPPVINVAAPAVTVNPTLEANGLLSTADKVALWVIALAAALLAIRGLGGYTLLTYRGESRWGRYNLEDPPPPVTINNYPPHVTMTNITGDRSGNNVSPDRRTTHHHYHRGATPILFLSKTPDTTASAQSDSTDNAS